MTRHDAAGVGPYLHEGARLASLRQLGWVVSEGDADVRGWEVRSISGRVLGTVHDLLVDEDAGEVVLLDIDLAGTSRRAVAPIRSAQVDRAARVVLVDSGDVQDAERFATPARHTETVEPVERVEGAERVERVDHVERVQHDGRVAGALPLADAPARDERVVSSEDGVVVEEVVVRRRVVSPEAARRAELRGARVARPADVDGLDDTLIGDDPLGGRA